MLVCLRSRPAVCVSKTSQVNKQSKKYALYVFVSEYWTSEFVTNDFHLMWN